MTDTHLDTVLDYMVPYQRLNVFTSKGGEVPLRKVIFRARIKEADPKQAYFDRRGRGIWLTGIFEHFVALCDITRLEDADTGETIYDKEN